MIYYISTNNTHKSLYIGFIFVYINKLILFSIKKLSEIDFFLFHQGSKFVLDALSKSLNIKNAKVIFNSATYGNTVSSSIPILLANKKIFNAKYIICSGFGVGLTWSSVLLKKIK